jgi:hypothetical protein
MIHALITAAAVLGADPAAELIDRARYVRPAGKDFAVESEIVLWKTKSGSVIDSQTGRGKTQLSVVAEYDEGNHLTRAEVTLIHDGDKKAVTVSAGDGKARVQRPGDKPQQFDVPAGVIVTSAPDWTDAFLLCRRYDRKKGGKQSFPGLWIHPEQATQQPTFEIERTGDDAIDPKGKNIKLDRYTIRLRGKSAYCAWADRDGKMIKLLPLPFKEGANNWIALEGFDKHTAGLIPR